MADTHEEQLLSRLLREVAREDARHDAAHLEARVLESASLPTKPARRTPVWIALPVAAALLLAVAATLLRPTPEVSIPERRVPTSATEVRVPPQPSPVVRRQPDRPKALPRRERQSRQVERVAEPAEIPVAESAAGELPLVSSPVAEMRDSVAPIEFVPLMPIAEQELSGPFQIVRVQLPSASLGPLRSPIARPDDIVEADVLLGEDGRARAIRVNSNISGSISPWRPK